METATKTITEARAATEAGEDAVRGLRIWPDGDYYELDKLGVAARERRVSVGRGPDADLRLVDDESLSREHCLIVVQPGGRVQVGDAGSRNGTIVSGARISAFRELLPGDLTTIGETEILACGRAGEAQRPRIVGGDVTELTRSGIAIYGSLRRLSAVIGVARATLSDWSRR